MQFALLNNSNRARKTTAAFDDKRISFEIIRRRGTFASIETHQNRSKKIRREAADAIQNRRAPEYDPTEPATRLARRGVYQTKGTKAFVFCR